jgi:hypothetical protein
MNTSEAMTLIKEKFGGRISVEHAEELERDFAGLERLYGEQTGKIIECHCNMVLSVLGAVYEKDGG